MITRAQRRNGLIAELRLRRKYRITLGTIFLAARELRDDDVIDSECNHAEAASLIVSHILADNPKLVSTVGFDFDELLKWIELLMPLIMLLISLF